MSFLGEFTKLLCRDKSKNVASYHLTHLHNFIKNESLCASDLCEHVNNCKISQ